MLEISGNVPLEWALQFQLGNHYMNVIEFEKLNIGLPQHLLEHGQQ